MASSPSNISLHLIDSVTLAMCGQGQRNVVSFMLALFCCSVPRSMRSGIFCLPSSSTPKWGLRSKKLIPYWLENGRWVTRGSNPSCFWQWPYVLTCPFLWCLKNVWRHKTTTGRTKACVIWSVFAGGRRWSCEVLFKGCRIVASEILFVLGFSGWQFARIYAVSI